MVPNGLRGEIGLQLGAQAFRLRPSFARLVAAEAETGSLLGLLNRASEGDIRLGDVTALLWHCLADSGIERAVFEQAVLDAGLADCLAAYRGLLLTVFKGG